MLEPSAVSAFATIAPRWTGAFKIRVDPFETDVWPFSESCLKIRTSRLHKPLMTKNCYIIFGLIVHFHLIKPCGRPF